MCLQFGHIARRLCHEIDGGSINEELEYEMSSKIKEDGKAMVLLRGSLIDLLCFEEDSFETISLNQTLMIFFSVVKELI